MAYNAKLGYDPNIDYSLAIKHSTDDAEIRRLQQERQNKINAQYGGADPYKNWDKTSNWSPQTATAAGNKVENTRQYGSDILLKQTQEPGMPQHEQVPKLPNLALEYDSFEDFLVGFGYGNYSEQTQSAIKAAVEKAVNGYEQQIRSTNDEAAELARQAYVSMMQGEKNLDQQLAAGGYAGGMADSQRIALQAGYENDLNALERQRVATINELQRAITNAQLTGDMQTAQELASYLQQIQSQWNNYVMNQQQMANDNYWRQQSIDADNQNRAREMALMIMQRGNMPDDETLNAAGISRAQAQALLETTGQTLQTGTPITTTSKSTGRASTAKANTGTNNARTEPTTSSGMNTSYFNAFASSIAAQIQSGKIDAAQANIASRWNELSAEQQRSIYTLLARFGY